MKTSRIALAALMAATILTISAPAEAKKQTTPHQPSGWIDVAAIPAYPLMQSDRRHRAAIRAISRRAAVDLAARTTPEAAKTAPRPSYGQTAIPAYRHQPGPAQIAARGLVVVDTCAGIPIIVSPGFAPKIQGWICEQIARGVVFATIHCAAIGGHVGKSLHYSGDACDHRVMRGRVQWDTAGDFGLRDGCGFLVGRAGHRHADCGHVDNAYAVGHPYVAKDAQPRRSKLARQSALEPTDVVEISARSSLVASINAKLARWVHPTGKCGGASEQLATYYWQGRRTATGELFNPDGMSAASRTLPFGKRLTVTNPHNGRSVVVVVNDRGPYTNAKIDLSRGAARALGMTASSYVCVL